MHKVESFTVLIDICKIVLTVVCAIYRPLELKCQMFLYTNTNMDHTLILNKNSIHLY